MSFVNSKTLQISWRVYMALNSSVAHNPCQYSISTTALRALCDTSATFKPRPIVAFKFYTNRKVVSLKISASVS